MKPQSTNLLFLSLILTLLCGTFLSLNDLGLIPLYAIYYGACFLLLKSFNYGEEFYETFDHSGKQRPEPKVIVAGDNISPGIEANRQEDRFLNIFETSRVVKRKILTWLLFLGAMWFVFYHRGEALSVPAVLPILSCFFIVNSFFVGHLLMVLLLSMITVILTYSKEVIPLYYFLYALGFLISLCLISFSRQMDIQAHIKLRKLKVLLWLSLLTFGLIFGFGGVIPGALDWKIDNVQLPDKAQRRMQQSLQVFQANAQKMQAKLPTVASLSPMVDKLSDLQKHLANNLAEIEQLKLILNKEDISAEDRAIASVKFEQVMRDQENLKESYNQLLESTQKLSTPTKSETEIFKNLGQELSQEERNHLRSYVNRNLEELKNLPSSKGQELEATLRQMEHVLNQSSSVQGIHFKPQLDQLEASKKEIEQKSKEEALKELNLQLIPENDKRELHKILNKNEQKSIFFYLKKFLPLFIIAFIALLLRYLLKKKGIKKVEATDPLILEELKEEWKKIRKLKLSPREEVIHFYNLFHETLKRMHYQSSETPPSCIVYEDMQQFNPELSKATLAITEIFAQCFYGNKNVDEKALKIYRKALGKILRVYQLE